MLKILMSVVRKVYNRGLQTFQREGHIIYVSTFSRAKGTEELSVYSFSCRSLYQHSWWTVMACHMVFESAAPLTLAMRTRIFATCKTKAHCLPQFLTTLYTKSCILLLIYCALAEITTASAWRKPPTTKQQG